MHGRPTDHRAHRGIGQGLKLRRRAVFRQAPDLDRCRLAELKQLVLSRVQIITGGEKFWPGLVFLMVTSYWPRARWPGPARTRQAL